jgi:hypothetical protein
MKRDHADESISGPRGDGITEPCSRNRLVPMADI